MRTQIVVSSAAVGDPPAPRGLNATAESEADSPDSQQKSQRHLRRSTRAWRHLAEAFALVLVLPALSLWPVLRPATDPPARADAVVVLSGDYGERRALAMSLVEKGLVHTLIFAGTPDRPDEDELCNSRQAVEYVCLRPLDDNTRAEARAVSDLARARQWRTVVVVTSRYHVTRSRLLFRRCVDAEVRMMAGDPPYSRAVLDREIGSEWLKVIYTVGIGPDC